MPSIYDLNAILENWNTILGTRNEPLSQFPERELWLVQAEDKREYYLKRLGPWRNLPLADEARVLHFLSGDGVNVADFIPTDRAKLYAGEIEDSFVLMPRLSRETFSSKETLSAEYEIGRLIGRLHVALAEYPWRVNSYVEDLQGQLERAQMLPLNVASLFAERRAERIAAPDSLPMQPVHGDLTPENIVLQRPIDASGFIDFEHLPLAPRIWDVAKYLSRRLRMRWRAEDQSPNHHRLEHIPPFLRGYQETNPLSSLEVAALPAMIAAANVIEVSYFMEIAAGVLERRRLSDHDEVLADSIEAAEWHLSHWDEVVNAVNQDRTKK